MFGFTPIQNTNKFDTRIAHTIIQFLDDFFNANTKAIIFVCDTKNNQDAARNRFFSFGLINLPKIKILIKSIIFLNMRE
jgi:hypothetical protein